jgi:alcohol dehydrogenase
MTKMRAMIVPEVRGQFRMEEFDLPKPGRHEVLIRVHACGVCHSDSFTVEGLAPGISYPRIPGHEVIGVIEALGPDVDGWNVGERAGVGWFGGSCGYCRNCRRGDAFACQTFTGITGITRDGGYATHMLALASALAKVPAAMNAVESAPLLWRVSPPSTRSGIAVRERATWSPFWVSGVSVTWGYSSLPARGSGPWRSIPGATRRIWRRSLGAHDYIDNAAADPAKALQAMGGAKAILATVTSAQAMQAIAGGLGPNGTMMMIGAVGPVTVDTISLIEKSASVRGWYSGTAPDSEDTLAFSQLNGVTSMNEIFPLEQAQAAYDRMMSGNARFRVVLDMGVQ